jgi:triosephosphate isomerase
LCISCSVEFSDSLFRTLAGSVKGSNAAELLAQGDIDGALVGGAALVAKEFVQIYNAGANKAKL